MHNNGYEKKKEKKIALYMYKYRDVQFPERVIIMVDEGDFKFHLSEKVPASMTIFHLVF